jgi:hypothetical protein
MIKSECDRCGATARVKGARVTLTQGSETAVYDRVKLPEGWWRMPVPPPVVAFDGCRELCPKCVNALALFFTGDGAVAGLLEPESLAHAEAEYRLGTGAAAMEPEGCTCPQPVPETPPCPIHDLPPLGEPDAEPEHEHEHNFDRLHGLCRCGSTYQDVLDRTAALNGPPELEHDTPECPFCPLRGFQYTAIHVREVHPERWDEFCGRKDPRPNLTARAEVLSSREATEAIRLGEKGGQLVPCPGNAGKCSGSYERGKFVEHMRDAHGA